jgi:hypothetical protein
MDKPIYKEEHIEELINCPMTRKEFINLPLYLRRKIIKRQVDKFITEEK